MSRSQREKGAQAERDVAKALGWRRGRAFSGEPDVYAENGLWIGSVKCRARWPKWMEEAVEDADYKAIEAGKGLGRESEPIVILMRRRVGAKPLVLIAHIGFDAWLADHGDGGERRTE